MRGSLQYQGKPPRSGPPRAASSTASSLPPIGRTSGPSSGWTRPPPPIWASTAATDGAWTSSRNAVRSVPASWRGRPGSARGRSPRWWTGSGATARGGGAPPPPLPRGGRPAVPDAARQAIAETYYPMAAEGEPWIRGLADAELRLLCDFLELGTELNLKNTERVRALPPRSRARRRGHPRRAEPA